MMPRLGGTDNMWMNGGYEALSILVLFPLIVMAGAGSNVTGRRSVALCKFFGEISYPLYITHFQLVYAQKAWVSYHPEAPFAQHLFVAIALYTVAIGIAYATLRLYDLPVRKYLTDRFLRGLKPKKSGVGASAPASAE